MLIVTVQQMQQIEAAAAEYNITPPRLMENAGSAAAAYIRSIFPVSSLNCIIFSGKGNNGGDGFVVARRLKEHGANVVVVLVEGAPKSIHAQQMLGLLEAIEVPVITMNESRELVESYTLHADLIIDAIYGTGFRGGRLPTPVLIACQMINEATAAVVSLDTPTGLTADHGDISFGHVKADFTVVFQLLKPLHVLPPSMEQCGQIQLVEIGIPTECLEGIEGHFGYITEEHVFASLPKRHEDSHKGNYGRLLAICGSSYYRGAAVLAAGGALRMGTGLCVVAAPETVCSSVSSRYPETILRALPTNNIDELDLVRTLPLIEEEMKSADAILIGCGSGRSASTFRLVEHVLKTAKVPVILDADALHVVSSALPLLTLCKAPVIVTPHPGEMADLANTTSGLVQRNRLNTALHFAEEYHVTVVLKGHETIVAQRDGRLFINQTGSHGLAKSGSGDILAGMIAGLIAQGMEPETASMAGVWLHGKAGDITAERLSQRGMLSQDVLDTLPLLFAKEDSPR